ncbi:sensor histidine kinase [Marinobacterium rhizophilum]|uniref:sensor histidine kinase n=1 Tax=Marinobacterium rhizophilum TaxID=420402 RepID=UPI00039EA260|nr:ATP-binding protein [Marinobacterium rhizophilum]
MNTGLAYWIHRIGTSRTSPEVQARPAAPLLPASLVGSLALEIAGCEDLPAELPALLAPLQQTLALGNPQLPACNLYVALQFAGSPALRLFHAPRTLPAPGLAAAITYQLSGPAIEETALLPFRRPGGGAPLQALRLQAGPENSAWLLLDFLGPLPGTERIAEQIAPLQQALERGLSIWHRQQHWRDRAVCDERRAFAAELHDSVTQVLGYLRLRTSKLQSLAHAQENAELRSLADDLAIQTRLACRQTRELIGSARLELDGGHLHSALESTVRVFEQGSALVFELDDRSHPLDLPEAAAVQLLFIVREALSNAVRHAHASHVRIQLLRPQGASLVLRIDDNGRGIDTLAARPDSFGLGIMQERARRMGASYRIGDRPGGGTRIEIALSLDDLNKSPQP